MRVISWNVNSVRARLEHVKQVLSRYQPDVLCLQETKVANEQFPGLEFQALGYKGLYLHGQKAHHGVAILARKDHLKTEQVVFGGKDDCRHIALKLPSGIEVHNFYVPSGGDEPDSQANPKFAHKVDFLNDMQAWFQTNRSAAKPMILVGDLNIAPLPTDVWEHKRLRKMVGHSDGECEKLQEVQSSLEWCDVGRHFVPPEEPLFSWWSYRSKTALENNRGWRLDHIWATQPLVPQLKHFEVLIEPRQWEKPSDHAPILVDLHDTP